jgi:predicted nucleic acid-binding protein
VNAWLEPPSVVLLAEGAEHWARLAELVKAGKIAGPRVHDARIAALCLQHGVREYWSVDRDFQRFPELKVVNPLVE